MELIFDNNRTEQEFKGSINDLLRHLNVMREEVVIKVNGKLVPETREIKENDRVEIIKVVFGG